MPPSTGSAPLWPALENARVLITGGTGFFGSWLLGTFLAANDEFGLKAEAVVVTRYAARYRREKPRLALAPPVRIVEGDSLTFDPAGARPTHVIHASGDQSVEGTGRVLRLGRESGAQAFLFASSGAVYEPAPGCALIDEDSPVPI